MSLWKLEGNFKLREMVAEEFRPFFLEHRPKLFSDDFDVMPDDLMTEEEKKANRELAKRLGDRLSVRLGLFDGERQIGWTFGVQIDHDRFYMVNSAVFPEYRRQGLYRAMLETMKTIAREHGFQIITSKHIATNSPIIIAKLKAGFMITGFELSDTFGFIVNLSYFTSPLRRKVMEFRAGRKRPDDELKSLFHLESKTHE